MRSEKGQRSRPTMQADQNKWETMDSRLVRTYIAGLRPFTGKSEDLMRFLSEVEEIIMTLQTLPDLEITIRFKQILAKLEEKARLVLYEKPNTWDQVRSLLIRNFADSTDVRTLITQMERIPYQGSIQRTYDAILQAQVKMCERIDFSRDPEEEKQLLRRCVKRRTFMHFRKSLPQACQGALTARNCDNISHAIQILHQEEFLNYDRYHEDHRAPNRVHHSSPNNRFEQRPSRPQQFQDKKHYPQRNSNLPNNQFSQNNYQRNQNFLTNRFRQNNFQRNPNFQNNRFPQNNFQKHSNFQNNFQRHPNFQNNFQGNQFMRNNYRNGSQQTHQPRPNQQNQKCHLP